jgi:hypothetical protein
MLRLLYPFIALLDFAFTLFCFAFVYWWAPLFARPGEVWDRGVMHVGPTLPSWLKWFDTFDADLDAGLPAGQIGTYWTHVKWLYRNPAYGLEYWLLGVEFDPKEWTVVRYEPGPSPEFYATGPNGAFCLRTTALGIQWKFGWKAWNYFLADNSYFTGWNDKPWGPEMRLPFTFSFSLAKK